MRYFLHCFSKAILFLLFMAAPLLAGAQILIQDFETLTATEQFASPTPNSEQVNSIRSQSNDDTTFLVVEEINGRRLLQLRKRSGSTVYFLKNQDFNNPPVLRLQFDLEVNKPDSVADGASNGLFADFFVGDQLDDDAFFPDVDERFATLSLNTVGRNISGDTQFTVRTSTSNGGVTTVQGETATLTTRSTISVFMNNSGGSFSYLAPDGTEQTLANNTLDIWVDETLSVDDASVQDGIGANEITSIKFLSRNNGNIAVAQLDNILVQEVDAYVTPQALTEAGGTFTVGNGGDFPNFTRPNGVFAALNALSGPVTGSFTFNVISDILNETGEVPLNQIAGTSEDNFILIQPATDTRTYLVSGSVSLAEQEALFYFLGPDYVRIDGRGDGNTSSGLSGSRNLTIRNANTAPTILFGNGSTNNYLGYSAVQGASSEPLEGVISLNGEGGNNSNITIEFNRLGGYANVFPLNTIASYNLSGNPNSNILVEGNQFYDFGAKGTNSDDYPSEVFIGMGSTDWTVRNNHFFQEGPASTASGNYAFRGIRVQEGTNYIFEGNYFGGSTLFAAGDPLIVNSPDTKGNYASLLPLSFSANGTGVFRNNVATNMEINGFPDFGEIYAFTNLVTQGIVDFWDNQIYNIAVSTNGFTDKATGGYFVIPFNFEYRSRPVKGTVQRNRVYDIRLSGNVTSSGQGGSYIGFRGVKVTSLAEVLQITDNLFSGVSTAIANNLGAELNGIVYLGGGDRVEILRNTICDFTNNSQYTQQIATIDPLEVGSTGIFLEMSNFQTDALVANNIISLRTDDPNSVSTLNGIYNKSNTQGTTEVYYNTVYFYGTDNDNVRANYVVGRENFNPMVIKNNILLNERSTDDAGFLLYTRNLTDYDSDYNLLYHSSASAANGSGYGYTNNTVALDLPGWVTLTRSRGNVQDENSISSDISEYFVNIGCNLRIVQTVPIQSPTIDRGTPVAAVNTDIDGNIRVDPDIGASEAFNTWIGVVSSDWNTGANWSTGEVPRCDAFNLVSIVPNGTAFNSPLVAGTVQFQPVIDEEDAVFRTLQIQNQASVTLAAADALLQQCELSTQQEADVLGIYNRGLVEYTAAGTVGLTGLLKNDSSWVNPQGTFLLNGQFAQNLFSTDTLTVSELRLKGAGNKELQTTLMVSDSLEFWLGQLVSKQDTFLIAGPRAMTDTANNQSYVSGPMLKMFDNTSTGVSDEFVFPTGDMGNLGRAALAVCSDDAVTYRAQYYYQSPDSRGYITEEPFYRDGIVEVTEQEFWEISRTSGSTEATVALYYDNNSGLPSPEDIVISRWATDLTTDGVNITPEAWISLDAQAVEGASVPDQGRIVSGPCITLADSALAVTFANTNPEIPLPVQLSSFTATLNGQNVLLKWETASEQNSSHFVVQRSLDGTNYQSIGEVKSAGNSQVRQQYTFTDELVAKQYAGIIYYQLVQVDFDGASKNYGPVRVKLPDPDFAIQGVYPNPFEQNLVVNIVGSKDQRISLILRDVEGRQLLSQNTFVREGENIGPVIQGSKLKPGVYILEVVSAEFTRQIKVIKK